MNIPYLPLQRITAMHGDEIRSAVAAVVASGRYLRGSAEEAFEQQYAAYIGTRCCVGTGNGYDALWLTFSAYKQLGRLHEGDEVLVSGHTFIASVLVLTDNGLSPVPVDAHPDTLELDDRLLENALTPRTKALLLVHLYGRCAYTQRIADFCKAHGLLLIEDNAQAQGAIYKRGEGKGERTGSVGDAAAHSFYPGKNLGALGDAGAVTTNDAELADTIRAIGNYGMARKYECRWHGRNSRMDELQAAVLSVKLCHLDADNARRREIALRYIADIDHPSVRLPHDDGNHVYHIFPLLRSGRDRLQQHLAAAGVETLIHYPIPVHRQQCYPQYHALSLPVAESIAQTELSLPCHPVMTDEEVDSVIAAVNSFPR